ncbi:MAG TPA: hypothetical protein VJ998_10170 [Pseudomonadales bacterium]|nr:hypothetical protein [Pseudomonadales bacterium]
MMLKRAIEHMRQQHWTGVFIELVIVILGVFIGLQASNWNEARQENAHAQRVIRDLAADMAEIRKQGDYYVGLYGGDMQSLDRVVTFFDSDAAAPANRKQFEKDLVTIISVAPPISRSPTMVELLSSGEIGLIKDESLRRSLIKLDQRIQTAAKINQGLSAGFRAYAIRLGDLIRVSVKLSDTTHTIIGVKSVKYDLAKMRADPQLMPALHFLLVMDNAELNYRRRIRDSAAKLLKRLAAMQ